MKVDLKNIKEKGFAKLISRIKDDDSYEINGENIRLRGDFYEKQVRLVLRNCGIINPADIEEYIGRDGYFALAKALFEMDRACLLYTSPSPRDRTRSRMPSSA